MRLKMDDIIRIVTGEGVYIDEEHPDHISLQDADHISMPFATVNKEHDSYTADGVSYIDTSRWVVRVYTADELPADVTRIMEKLVGADQRPAYERAYMSDLFVYRHQLTF